MRQLITLPSLGLILPQSLILNEVAAFPHARIDGIASSVVSLGLTRQGVMDEPTEKPIELLFLIFSLFQLPDEQVRTISLASRLSQDRHFCQRV